ncbi:unnamed protein product [Acanthoscelides obtectus]|uniref:Uncharacterized protein n=1 Tax=Acanthoscelides obtectus TaxID=200917 RepID=A0A9P0LVA9_ACAOB|nr:unnamed protein product [Acanthoscelides obtectus]CAK1646268.1 hypothetical protein AOBTE_LOCUS14543 [Acanthoscelides obtectus]
MATMITDTKEKEFPDQSRVSSSSLTVASPTSYKTSSSVWPRPAKNW